MRYIRSSNDAHVLKTEQALKHWDKRRAADLEWKSTPMYNIGQLTYRHDALFRAMHHLERLGLDTRHAEVLDVGCGWGDGLFPFLSCGFSATQLHGIDLYADRIATCQGLLPGLDVKVGDASAIASTDGSFDVVCEQFCFCHIPDDAGIKPKIAKEMLRIVKPRGFILIHDWRIGSESRMLYAVSQKRIAEWFSLPVIARFRSQLFPPLGRPISMYAPSMYALARHIPFATGSWITVLRK